MDTCFAKLERCAEAGRLADDASLTELLALLQDPEWRVRYAAAVALGDRRDARAVAPLVACLAAEDAAPLFTQKTDIGSSPAGYPFDFKAEFPPDLTPETRACWERRGRVKQAASLALGAIGKTAPEILAHLHRYVTDPSHDPEVRAAAAKALGLIGDPTSRPHIEKATQDFEWCTRTEAQTALRRIAART